MPLGKREVVGVVVDSKISTREIDTSKLKSVKATLDEQPILPENILKLAGWMSRYYLHEFSSSFLLALPKLLRDGEPATLAAEKWLSLTIAGEALEPAQLKRSEKQQALLSFVQQQRRCSLKSAKEHGHDSAQVKALEKKNFIEVEAVSLHEPVAASGQLNEPSLRLNDDQQHALAHLNETGFQATLLEGVTGSGKTEVYLQAIERCLKQGRRALVLVPEIGLTPQTLRRFQNRFADEVISLHSGLSDNQRKNNWLKASLGQAAILIGTRSAILTPIPDLGLIVVDEEHDQSYKQQDTLRYQARDIALMRARNEGIPIILGTATPSLESLHHARNGHYSYLQLNQRAAGQSLPHVETVDMRKQDQRQGLSEKMLLRIKEHLGDGNQVLLFLNRRGYAPSWFCEDCGWIADCVYCDAHLTHHRHNNLNICHHCGFQQAPVRQCPNCHSHEVSAMGTGTERAEELLAECFAEVPIIRFDSNITSTRKKFEEQLKQTEVPGPAIIIGTQMLAKGHHFERVTLVGIWDIDTGLFSADLRARERMGQLLTQVAGRSGRGSKRGEVLIQTHYPDNPIFEPLLKHDYRQFAVELLEERQRTGLPPFGYLAVIRADSPYAERCEARLKEMAHYLIGLGTVRVLGPLPALMSRRAGKHRYMIIVQSDKRSTLHQALNPLHKHYPREAQQVSWHIDIDPADLA
ncbi:replication restart DNA helicase PriA [Reinekea marinisedimentorum]|uniref:Replication restart protein PriA n=1 Tax=Reinekea marinisedimentorum TaxID=230495 RepID=A0A4R3I9V3_9GAMM|nr:replication restart DNA helicase PriA [Reinekea marinisedimentorum]